MYVLTVHNGDENVLPSRGVIVFPFHFFRSPADVGTFAGALTSDSCGVYRILNVGEAI